MACFNPRGFVGVSSFLLCFSKESRQARGFPLPKLEKKMGAAFLLALLSSDFHSAGIFDACDWATGVGTASMGCLSRSIHSQ
jgi:hypothetical protein